MLGNFIRQLLGRASPTRRREESQAPWIAEALNLQRHGRHRELAEISRSVLAREPDNVDALQMLAAALFAQGKTQEGLACLDRAAEQRPDSAEAQANLAAILAATGDLAGAIERYRRAVRLRPEFADAWNNLALLLKALGRYDEAEDTCRAGLSAGPRHAFLHHTLASVLFEQGRVDSALAAARASLALDPGSAGVHGDLLRMLNYADGQDPAAVYREHCAWGERHARPLASGAPPHRNDPDATRRLRVGFVSPYFRKHAMTFFFESFAEHHERERLELVLYADVEQPDEYSARLQGYGAAWRRTIDLNDEALAGLVRKDAVDILVDLSGHTPRNRLLAFARRAAPVQVTWNGYPNTTGMTAMDYRITDAQCDPPGQTEMLHTERLVRLPEIYMSWRPPADVPEPGPLPARSRGHVTFGSFNSCFKITATTLGLWSAVLSAVPGSRLKLFTVTGERAAGHLQERFASHGIAPERLEIVPRLSHEDFLAAHRDVDVALDTFPYHGTTTTCFSLWMGVPVVSLVGSAHVSRVGLTLLSNIGLGRLAAPDRGAYVETAVKLARDSDALEEMRSGLRQRMLGSPLTDGAACARALGLAFGEMWLAWCASAR